MLFGRNILSRQLSALLLLPALLIGVFLLGIVSSHYPMRDWIIPAIAALAGGVILIRVVSRSFARELALIRRCLEHLEQGDYAGGRRDPLGREDMMGIHQALIRTAEAVALRDASLRTQNQSLAAGSHRLQSVLNAAQDGIAMLDSEGRFVLANRRFGELLGCRADALLTQKASAQPLLQKLLEEFPQPGMQAHVVSEQIIEMEDPVLERRSLLFYTAPVPGEDGIEISGTMIALRDITRERELDKLKTDFISVVSHELRTPLTSIRGYTDLLVSGATGEINELQSEFLGIIQNSTLRLSNLINDILDISRIESGSMQIKYESIDYRRIVMDTLRLMRAFADEKKIIIDASLPEFLPSVRGDGDKVTQVLTNLVSNAIKYTPEGGWVKVSLDRMGESSLVTTVADSGIGISQDDQKKLFQKFFRADNTSTREVGGTGLGLAISKTLIELLGGAIWVESEPGSGTSFHFTLPVYQDSSDLTPPAPLDRGIGLVLVIDDNLSVRSRVRHALHRRGYGIMEAGDSDNALHIARQHKPDAITLNMLLPGLGGLHILRELKADRASASIPVVLVTVPSDLSRGEFTMGDYSFLQEPLTIETICAAIFTVLSQHHGSQKALAVCRKDSAASWQFLNSAPDLLIAGITLDIRQTATESIGYVISEAPSIIFLDSEMAEEELFALLKALKDEEEAAQIPIVLVTKEIAPDGIYRPLVTDEEDNVILLDDLCDHVSRAVSEHKTEFAVLK